MAPGGLISIVGPTASGKTALAIRVAEELSGEIICADSRTVYKGLDIATAKPSRDERNRVPHHALDVVTPDEPFTVADFKQLADKTIKDIQDRGKIPILVGGSGLYIDAVLFNYSFSPHGSKRDLVNTRHVDKASQGSRQEVRRDTLIIGLRISREVLRLRIEERIQKMIELGLNDEVRWLMTNYPNSKALDSPGYKAFYRYITGDINLEDATILFTRNDFSLAKRQMTWFKRNKHIQWFDDANDAFVSVTKSFIDSKKMGKNNAIITKP